MTIIADQIFTSLAVSTGCLSYGICMAYTSSAIPSMLDPNSSLTITYSEASWMSSLLALGAMFGSLSAVFLMDAVGRKASLLAFSVMSLFIGWTMMMAASQAWQLYVGRFLLGLGAGLEITISPVYIHETTKPELRDVCGSFPQVITWNLTQPYLTLYQTPGDDRPGHRLLLHHGSLPRLELAEPRLLRLPRPLHLRPLLHPREPALARLQ